MILKEVKTEQNQTLSMVPLGIWRKFKSKCAEKGITMTAGFIEAVTKWMEAS
ncbi:hypothetical protein KAR91_59240 [Candidatus Pacearchaeota archaeon]|nr:hypothetical protein [Candidatus Pacearchaeota archaeon]